MEKLQNAGNLVTFQVSEKKMKVNLIIEHNHIYKQIILRYHLKKITISI